MLKLSSLLLSAAMLFSLSTEAKAVPTPENPVELTMSSSWLETHPGFQLGFKPWIEEIYKRTNGAVKITFYNPNTLTPEREVYSGVANGIIDIGFTVLVKTPGKFPLGDIAMLPAFGAQSSESVSRAAWEIYNTYPQWRNEYKDVKMLAHFGATPLHFFMTEEQMEKKEDLDGKKIITGAPAHSEMVSLLGGSAVNMLSSETYMALERGIAEGYVNTITVARTDKTSEVAKYTGLAGVTPGIFFVAMNKDTWDSLGPKIQAVFNDLIGDNLARRMGKAMDNGEKQAYDLMVKEGQKFYKIPQAELDRMGKALQPMYDEFFEEYEKKYPFARQLQADYAKLLQKYEKQR